MPSKTTRILLTALMLSIASAPALADKGGKHGHDEQGDYGKGSKGNKGGKKGGDHGHDGGDVNISIGAYFGGTQRQVVHDYYGSEFKSGHCPPGLAKKHNGCLPPGQAKKWAKGKPLPHDLVYYPVPSVLVTRLGPPPAGYKYVRVASDILLITIGTSMVVDAIEDLGGL